jgi:chemotaxis response regulator CheB
VRVVGIGASAGGIESLKEFFEAMPADTGMFEPFFTTKQIGHGT